MALSDFVSVSISLTPQTLTRPGYGEPLILAADCPAGFTNRVREYNTLADLVADGFSTSGSTYLLATQVKAQSPCPPKFKVGRLANKPTQSFTILPVAINSQDYNLKINGHAVKYTSDSSATITEISTGLKTAIDLLSLAVTTSVDGTSHALIIVANTAGAFFNVGTTVSSGNTTLLNIVQDHVDPGAAADLTAIAAEDNAWYCILNPCNSLLMVNAIAGYAETANRLFLFNTVDSDAILTVPSGATDVIAVQKSNARFWTSGWYTPYTGDFLAASVAGALLPDDPGSEQWALKTLSGVTASNLTATQRSNLMGKNGNDYEIVGNLSITNPGKVGSGEWIDVVRFRDWLTSEIQDTIFDTLRGLGKKLPYTDAGIQAVKGAIKSVLKRGVDVGGLSDSPAPSVIVPFAADVSSGDRASRTLTGVSFTAQLAGAIIAVKPVTGVLLS